MKHLCVTLGMSLGMCLAAVALPACAQDTAAKEIALIPERSRIGFVARQMGVALEGTFKRFQARIVFDSRQPEAGRMTLSVDTGSVSIGLPEGDAELLKEAWFAAGRFPQARFESSAIRRLGPNRIEVAGTLSLKGRVRTLALPITLTSPEGQSMATGSFTLKRLDFGIGEGPWADTSVVADEVQVRFQLVLRGLDTP